MLARLRTSFLTGIVVIAPVALTIWLIWSVIGWFDGFVLPFVPDAYRPEKILNTLWLRPQVKYTRCWSSSILSLRNISGLASKRFNWAFVYKIC